MKRPLARALQGLALSASSPLGWMALQWYDGANVALELAWHPGVYVYMLVGTAFAFSSFGWYVGWREEESLENSLHDALTGLYNTRYFRRRLAEEHAFAVRHGRPLALLIGDLDWFKRVNDRYGHVAGDQVLAAVAGALMGPRRRGDTVARVGGEEFAMLLPETDLAEAVRVAERLREAVAGLRFEFAGTEFGVTMSFGAAVSSASQPLGGDALYERADAAMYGAKRAGRDRVSVDPLPPAAPAAAAPALNGA